VALLVGFLAGSQDLDYLHVFRKHWYFDEVGRRAALALGLVVSDQVDLLRVYFLSLFFLFGSDSTDGFLSLHLLLAGDHRISLIFLVCY
jgi:hypothetical protein